jgi:hypothetical protein
MDQEFIYRCTAYCNIGKHCFVLKTKEELKEPITVLQKCEAKKKDITIVIGRDHKIPP